MDSEYILNNDLPYLMYRLREAGLTVELDFDQTRRRMLLLLNGSVKWSIHDLTLKLSGAEPAAHQAMMEPWIPYLMELTRLGQTVLRNPEELNCVGGCTPSLSSTTLLQTLAIRIAADTLENSS